MDAEEAAGAQSRVETKAFKFKLAPNKKPDLKDRQLRFGQLLKCLEKYDIIDQQTNLEKGKHRLYNTKTGVIYPINWIKKPNQQLDKEFVSGVRRHFGLVPPRVECHDFYK